MSDFERPEWTERFRPPDYLWPARPEYLRLGTRVEPEPCAPRPAACGDETRGVVVCGPSALGWLVFFACDDVCDWCADGLLLDLRDVTARAHAAMAYTATSWPGRTNAGNVPMGCEVACWIAGRYHDHARARALCRMRCMDESVTVAEARAALAWAESVVGVPDDR